MTPGIDRLAWYTPHYRLELGGLAAVRGIPAAKFSQGLGQDQMSVPPPGEDVVTMGANAALLALKDLDPRDIGAVLFATETGIDQSKAAAIYLHRLLELPADCQAFELKQACCSSAIALQLAVLMVTQNPRRKVLVVAADVARYGLGTAGEPTQGAGAAAMVVSAEPQLLALDPASSHFTEDTMDFWRPNYRDEALVDGKHSIRVYLRALGACWAQYAAATGRRPADFARFCYHMPFTRMAAKAHAFLLGAAGVPATDAVVARHIGSSLVYNRLVGNSYTASLFIGLASLLETDEADLGGERVAFFAYGSGCVGTFFSGVVQAGYQAFLPREEHQRLLEFRTELSCAQYEDFYRFRLPEDGKDCVVPATYDTGAFRLAGIAAHQRQYVRVGSGLALAPHLDAVAESHAAGRVNGKAPKLNGVEVALAPTQPQPAQ